MASQRKALGITTLDWYLFTQLLTIIFFGVLLFSIIWLAPETLFKLIQYVSSGRITALEGARMLLYHLPGTLEQAIPMAVFFGSLFLFRRLSQQYELIVFFACGISLKRLLIPVFVVGLLFSGVHILVQEVWAPVAIPHLDALYRDRQLKPLQDANFSYVDKNRLGQVNLFFLIGQTQEYKTTGALKDFVILYFKPSPQGGVRISRILRAPAGYWEKSSRDWHWRLLNGVDYELNEDGVYERCVNFKYQFVNTSQYPYQLLQYGAQNPVSLNFNALSRYLKLLQQGGQLQDIPFYEVRLYQKISLTLASAVLAVIGAILGMEHPRSRYQLSLVFAAVLLFCYCVLIPFTTNLGSLGILPAVVVAWLPLVLTSLLAFGLGVWKRKLQA